jgi:hypothetical protein
MKTTDGVIEYALSLWADHMANNFSEIRALWYPARTPGLSGGWVVSQDAFEDLECECEQRIVQVVQGAVTSMPPAMRAALELSLGLSAVVRVKDYEGQLAEARARVFRAVVGAGVV